MASANARLTARGRIGGGVDFVSIPTFEIKPVFGGTLSVSGQIKINAFWGLAELASFGPKTFLTAQFGDKLPGFLITDFKNAQLSSKTYAVLASLSFADVFPQPSMSSNDSNVVAVWLETSDKDGRLFISSLGASSGAFSNPLTVAANSNSINNPKVAVFSDGSAVVSWSQNRFSASTLPKGATILDALAAQDIWVGLFDSRSNSISSILRIPDDTSRISSGRVDGEGTITARGNSSMLVWVAKDSITSTGNSLWYCINRAQNGKLQVGTPLRLTTSVLSGFSKNIDVVYTGDNSALAVWIQDLDGNETTLANVIYSSSWNGAVWSSPQALTSVTDTMTSYNKLSLAFRNRFGVLGWTQTSYRTDGTLIQSINGQVWDSQNGSWIQGSSYQVSDSIRYFQKPVVTISDSNIVTIAYQSAQMLGDSTKPDAGKLNLLALDLRKQPLAWQTIESNMLSDTTLFVREYDAAFGRNNSFYVLAQEEDSLTGRNRVVRSGTVFGNPQMNLVLRSVQLSSDMRTTIPIASPQTPTNVLQDFPVQSTRIGLSNYPNPFHSQTIIEFTLPQYDAVKLEVFDILGRNLGTLLNMSLGVGTYQTIFESDSLQSGSYICRLTVGDKIFSKMMQVLH